MATVGYRMSRQPISLIGWPTIFSVLFAASVFGEWSGMTSPEPSLPWSQASIGKVWHVKESGGWAATWTRRDDSFLFDGIWLRPGEVVTGVLAMTVQGRTVRIQSRQRSSGDAVEYEGTLAGDGKNIRGTCRVAGTRKRLSWEATIDASNPGTVTIAQPPPPPLQQTSLGRIWHVTGTGGWAATWTRRGDSLVYDGIWLRPGEVVTGVLAMTVQGRTVRIQSRQQSNGQDLDYEGTLAGDGKSILGMCGVVGASNKEEWTATIDN